jgi:hypothetical protein
MNQLDTKKKMICFPVIFTAGFIPLVMHLHTYNTGYSIFDWAGEGHITRNDFFLYWKMILIIAAGIIMAAVLLYNTLLKKEKLRFERSFYLLFFYALFCFLSAIFSANTPWVFTGAYDLMEPVWCLLAYMVFCFYTYHYVQKESQVYFVTGGVMVAAAFLFFIGYLQYSYLDPFNTAIGRKLLTFPYEWDATDHISIFTDKGISYLTLYNPNYVSLYCGIFIPLLAGLFLGCRQLRLRILIGVAAFLSVMSLIGDNSLSGWLGIAMAFVVVAIVLASRRKKHLLLLLSGLFATGLLGVILCLATPLGERVAATFIGTYHLDEMYALRSIETMDTCVRMDFGEKEMILSYDYDEETGETAIRCSDANGNDMTRLAQAAAADGLQFDSDTYAGCSIYPVTCADQPGIALSLNGVSFIFSKGEDGTYYYYYNINEKWIKLEPIQSVSLFRDDALSGRGRIWDNTIPLLKNHLLLGCGANTYAMEYPQMDLLSSVYGGTVGMINIKAHSWYLMEWVENGLPAMLAMIGFLLCYFVRSIRLYRRIALHDCLSWIGLSVFTGLLSYAIIALANDSLVVTAPVFWIMLGLGMAVNRMLSERIKAAL